MDIQIEIPKISVGRFLRDLQKEVREIGEDWIRLGSSPTNRHVTNANKGSTLISELIDLSSGISSQVLTAQKGQELRLMVLKKIGRDDAMQFLVENSKVEPHTEDHFGNSPVISRETWERRMENASRGEGEFDFRGFIRETSGTLEFYDGMFQALAPSRQDWISVQASGMPGNWMSKVKPDGPDDVAIYELIVCGSGGIVNIWVLTSDRTAVKALVAETMTEAKSGLDFGTISTRMQNHAVLKGLNPYSEPPLG
jgi:hypothetical protein